jgi:hypothetical protein
MRESINGVTYQSYWQDRRDRDGSSMELMDETNGPAGSEIVAEVFCPDYSDKLFLTLFRAEVPTRLIAALIAEGEVQLPEAPTTAENSN